MEVIDFSIKGDYVPAAARLHRLGGPEIEVKDGEAPMSEDHALPSPGALVVGTATTHMLQRAAQRSTVQQLLTIPKCRNEAAHQRLSALVSSRSHTARKAFSASSST